MPGPQRAIAVVGTYVPRRCGIATFTGDLVAALRGEAPESRVSVVAMNDARQGYDYGEEVSFEINERQLQDYRAAAEFLNAARVETVSVQHEFGIYGGVDGGHVLKFLGHLRVPAVTTLHTVLRSPSASQRAVIRELDARSDRLVVMTETARRFLDEVYGISPDHVRVIPHGIPDLPFVDPNFYKDQFGVAGRKVLLTFGLLSRNKGIDSMIRALPKVAARHPDVVYVVLGATHPQVRRQEGEAYRLGLRQLARKLGVDERVLFHDRFVSPSELAEFLGAADLYVTPYLDQEQAVSGTLAYAMGAGKAVVATTYWHAQEMLADGRGRLVPCGDSEALGQAVIELFDDDTARHAIRKRAYTYTRDHIWREVGKRHLALFDEVRDARSRQPRPARLLAQRDRYEGIPELDLSHLERLTDDVGILQHARWQVPDRSHGWCTDDNARALLVATQAHSLAEDPAAVERLALRYLAFLRHAFDPEKRAFRNFMGYHRGFVDDRGSDDCQGRAARALAVAAVTLPNAGLRSHATDLLHAMLPTLESLEPLRPVALAQLGLDIYLERHGGDSAVKRARQLLAERLLANFVAPSAAASAGEPGTAESWSWPEPQLTYANAVLPHALIESGAQLGRREMTTRGLAALDWLMEAQTQDGRFSPIGNRGWYPRGGPRARFDQQPIEAGASVVACAAAFRASGEEVWLTRALRAFRWFLGENDVGAALHDPTTGGCRDGLHPDGVNVNQGAESTLTWLSALIEMHALEAAGQLTGRLGAATGKKNGVAAGEAAAR
jgi:glycosyltransferase involved in cell wall biosynthesis